MSTAIVIGTRFPAPPTPSTDADEDQLKLMKPKKVWEQEVGVSCLRQRGGALNGSCGQVRDEEGRRRFHGAFTGGFSAGYYNTVGTKEGWAPATFTSSRKARAAPVQQKPEVKAKPRLLACGSDSAVILLCLLLPTGFHG